MYFNEIQVENYKCFKDKVILKLEKGINIIVGKNSVGKTALLEAISLKFQDNPYISLETFPKANRPPHSTSKVSVSFTIERDALIDLLLMSQQKGDADFNIPVDKRYKTELERDSKFKEAAEKAGATIFGREYFSSHSFTFKLQGEATGQYGSWTVLDDCYIYPELERLEENDGSTQFYLKFRINLSDRTFDFKETNRESAGGRKYRTDFTRRIAQDLSQNIFRFQAERIPDNPCELGQSGILESDSRNLAEVLNLLQANTSKFKKFTEMVRQVLPNNFQIGVLRIPPKTSNSNENLGKVIIWNSEKEVDYNHLAKPLNEVGSAVGQILAILYVLLEEEPKVILIDEPQSFLHPDAARKLIEIIRFNGKHHQVIIATHSPTIITMANPQTVTLIKQNGSESFLENIDIHQIESQRVILGEIGARFSDVFGYDRVIWVEGDTEEICFPKIVGKNQPVLGTAILRVQHTGDFDKKDKKYVENIVAIYQRLSNANNGLLPMTVDFIFDKETRSSDQVRQLEKLGFRMQNRKCVHLTSKRMYENYLLNPDAVTAVINEIDTNRTEEITLSEVTKWIEDNNSDSKYYENKKNPEKSQQWKDEIHGANFLTDLFNELIQTKGLDYDKKIHSVRLTEWIIENSFDDLKEIAELIEKLIKMSQ